MNSLASALIRSMVSGSIPMQLQTVPTTERENKPYRGWLRDKFSSLSGIVASVHVPPKGKKTRPTPKPAGSPVWRSAISDDTIGSYFLLGRAQENVVVVGTSKISQSTAASKSSSEQENVFHSFWVA
ncbi:hypothetical protein NL676_019973 [Syzygium grande]|nr:hypothetical protein NL676_019973 [Syzygium grande]